jgi:putative proteasome-type protease
MQRRFDQGDAYFTTLSAEWSAGVRKVFRELPELEWSEQSPLAAR